MKRAVLAFALVACAPEPMTGDLGPDASLRLPLSCVQTVELCEFRALWAPSTIGYIARMYTCAEELVLCMAEEGDIDCKQCDEAEMETYCHQLCNYTER